MASRNLATLVMLTMLALLMAGCASNPANPHDPLERYNRSMYSFNDAVDRAVVRPVAEVYEGVTPQFVRTGVGNFFGNLNDLWIGTNNMLQGKFADGWSDWMRVVFNSTFGLLGVIDIASDMGLTKHDEDFGQTLGVWGVGEGAYVVLPLLGPRTVRDASALPVDFMADTVTHLDHVRTRNSLTGLRLVHGRAQLLGADQALKQGTTDEYAYMRDFYLQQRRYKVLDGNVTIEYEDFDDLED
jgi:phospholipid-binding lipoprotein MlaA